MTSPNAAQSLEIVLVEEALPPEFEIPSLDAADRIYLATMSADDPHRSRLLLRSAQGEDGSQIAVSDDDRRTAQFDLNLRNSGPTNLLFNLVASGASSWRPMLLATPRLVMPLILDQEGIIHACRSDRLSKGGVLIHAEPVRPVLAIFDRGPGPRSESNHARFSKLSDLSAEIHVLKDSAMKYGLSISEGPVSFG